MGAKRRKPEMATVYAIRTKDGWWLGPVFTVGSFANAMFFRGRAEAKGYVSSSDKIVPCRVRVLPSAKKAPKRTR